VNPLLPFRSLPVTAGLISEKVVKIELASESSDSLWILVSRYQFSLLPILLSRDIAIVLTILERAFPSCC